MFDFPFHIFFVHFPIALLLVAIVYDVRGRSNRSAELHDIGYRLTLWAAAGGAFAAATGLEIIGNRLKTAEGAAHAALGMGGGFAMIILAALRYSANARKSDGITQPYPLGWFVLELVTGLVIVLAAITGHGLVF